MGIRKNLKRGFTLVELMIVVAIIGILAALAIYGVRRYVTNAKTAEARNSLGAIAKSAAMSYDRESMPGVVLAASSVAGASNSFCGAASAVPSATASIAGQKYQSGPAEWGGDASTGWKCLMFSMEQPQYYQYSYVAGDTIADRSGNGNAFTAVAVGNLDGDNLTSQFQLRGALEVDENAGTAMKVAPNIIETNPDE